MQLFGAMVSLVSFVVIVWTLREDRSPQIPPT